MIFTLLGSPSAMSSVACTIEHRYTRLPQASGCPLNSTLLGWVLLKVFNALFSMGCKKSDSHFFF